MRTCLITVMQVQGRAGGAGGLSRSTSTASRAVRAALSLLSAVLARGGRRVVTVLINHRYFRGYGLSRRLRRRYIDGASASVEPNKIEGRDELAAVSTAVPVVMLVINGGKQAEVDVLQAVRNDWELIVVKGSGGYADWIGMYHVYSMYFVITCCALCVCRTDL
jgi:hypothetical protein